MTRLELLSRLGELKPWLAAQGISRVQLFGSYARDQARQDSDVDLLVETSRPLGLAFFGIQNELSRQLGKNVELFEFEDLHPVIRPGVVRDLIDA
ncbi:MAG TPA: hypothetical protein DCL54_06840 [Alphaproteobacteria bacterium]|nr:hypothetical protein [Alphaproteobacteria bacterium]HAJ46279.1 hypothetical protein [Alphaproteobacteria bacterium]